MRNFSSRGKQQQKYLFPFPIHVIQTKALAFRFYAGVSDGGKENRSLFEKNLFHLYMKLPSHSHKTLRLSTLRRKLFDFLLIIEMSLFIDSISCEKKKKDFFILLNLRQKNMQSAEKKILRCLKGRFYW